MLAGTKGLQDKIGPQKVRIPASYDLLDDVTAFRIRLGRDQRADGEAAQGIGNGKRCFCGIFSTRERQGIRPALPLSIRVDSAELVWQGINELDELSGSRPGYATAGK